MRYPLYLPGITLVPAEIGRAERIGELIVEAQAQRYFGGGDALDEAYIKQLIIERGAEGRRSYALWTVEPEGCGAVGLCGVAPVRAMVASHPLMNGGYETMVALEPGARGRGIATKALRAISKLIAANSRIKRLVAAADPANAPSHRLLTRCAYQMMGRLTDAEQPLLLYERIFGLAATMKFEEP